MDKNSPYRTAILVLDSDVGPLLSKTPGAKGAGHDSRPSLKKYLKSDPTLSAHTIIPLIISSMGTRLRYM